MIIPKIAPQPSILVVYDTPQTSRWMDENAVSLDGIAAFMARFAQAGIDLQSEVSVICLADVMNPKAADFKVKQSLVADVIETYGFNLLVPIGAKAFEKVMGHKGIEKYFGKALYSEAYKTKVVPCPNPGMVRYKPEIAGVLDQTVRLIAAQKGFAEVEELEKMPTHYHVVDSIGKFRKVLEVFLREPVWTYDLETTSLDFNRGEILTIQLTHKEGYSYLIPSRFYNDDATCPSCWSEAQWQEIVEGVCALFDRTDCEICGANLKFDLKFSIKHLGVRLPPPEQLGDTQVMAFLVDENTPNDLKYLACTLTDMGDYEKELDAWKKDYCKKHKMKQGDFNYGMIPFSILKPYALADTDATLRVRNHLRPLLEAEEQVDVYRMLMRFLYATCRMELNGWPVDIDYAKRYLVELDGKIAAMEEELRREPEVEKAKRILEVIKLQKENEKRKTPLTELKKPFVFNFNSTDQKRVLFFDVLNLPVVKYTKTKDANGNRTTPSTDKEVVDEWIMQFPRHEAFLTKLRTYSELNKMRSTYVKGIIDKAVQQPDGTWRIYPLYNITGAKTGRLSSKNPNFQNIPAHNAEAKNVKRIICPQQPGWEMLGADLGAAEMRYACICSGDVKLKAIFNGSGRVHEEITKEVFDLTCDLAEIKGKFGELRRICKTIQFLTLYGGGAETLAGKIKIGPERAEATLRELACSAQGVPQDTPLEMSEVDQILAQNQEQVAGALCAMFAMSDAQAMRVLSARDKVTALREAFTRSRDEAQQLIDYYFKKYSGVNSYINHTIMFTKQNGYSLSLLGRRRRVPGVLSDDGATVERAVRQAVNATIQSIASDGLMLSACELIDYLEREGVDWLRVLGPVHDALYCEVRSDKLHEAKAILVHYLEQYPEAIRAQVDIPMVCDPEHGPHWAAFTEEFDDEFVEVRPEDEEEEDEAA